MQRFRNILVGVDLSHADRLAASELNPPTLEAVKRAIWLAGHLAADLTFFAAIDVSAATQELLHDGFGRASRNVEDEAQLVLGELVSRAKHDGVEAKYKLVFGQPWLEIIRRVEREGQDLVIVGTRDLGAAGRMLFGSTGIKLLRYCPCPVWITKPDPDWETFNVLVASDLSDVAQDALQIAVGGGQLADCKIHLLHAIDFQIDRHLWLTGLPEEQIDEFRQRKRAETEQALHEQLAQTDHRTLKYGVQVHVVEGPADVVIEQAIQDYDIDLLVMGTMARTGISGMIMGNTAERLLPGVTCSVLAVKPADFISPVQAD